MAIEFELPGAGPQDFDKIDRQEDSGPGSAAPVIRIDYDMCDASGACAQVCPEDVLEFTSSQPMVIKAEACTECWICVENCTSGAIEIG